jgi:ABC-type methionine transport system ATPase subunit
MVRRQVMFTFPQENIREPIIYNLSHQFQVVTNIRRADISDSKGWVVLELEGEDKEIDEAISWVTSRGVRVDPVIGDVVEG